MKYLLLINTKKMAMFIQNFTRIMIILKELGGALIFHHT